MKQKHIVKNVDLEGLRVDKYLADLYEDISRSELKKYFNDLKIFVNEKPVKSSQKVYNNDIIEVEELELDLSSIVAEEMELDIVYEDDDVIVINKPSGMVVHPAPGHYTGTLVNGLLYHCQTLSDLSGEFRLGIVHRIDKDTSGLLVACKNNFAHNFIADQLREKTTTRKYLAIVSGVINHNYGKINAPVGRDLTNRLKMCVCEDGKSAVTNFKVIERFHDNTLLELQLETGRTHQIRVHLAYINFPVLGDPLYGKKNQSTSFGQYLHARTLGFIHPKTNEYLEFCAPLPMEFNNKITELKNQN